ncbi:MAG TPA: hypothetical protein VMO47_04460 [Rhodothermales bacterium]|nr:hypothetical protein [Rhodothermales bacterium]
MPPTIAKSLLVVLVLGLAVTNANAQDVTYKTTTKTELHVLGFLGGLFDGETKEEVSIKGYKMRSDGENQSTIMDLDGERMISINHKKKEYSVITFAEMAEMMSEMGTRMKAEAGEATPRTTEGDAPEYEVEFDLEVKDTGKSKKIDKYNTEQKVLILETRFKPKDASADTLPSGSFFAITDMWVADDVPEMEPAESFQRRMAEVMQSNLASMDMAGVINQLLDSYPQVGAAMERSNEEMAKVEGFPMATTMHLVSVPIDTDLDLELALGEKKKEKKGGGFGGLLKKVAEAQVGIEGEAEKAAPEQKTIMSAHSTTHSISNKSRSAADFEPPSKYKEVEYESPFKDTEKK